MQLSVIIVNYNVKYFLEQCLYSVQAAINGFLAEIIVVDNNSTDGSLTYLQPLFPNVKWIVNTENTGFGAANNQAVAIAKGEYILFLNPDTLLPEDSLQQCLAFMKCTPKAGALGIKMLDGSGQFLPESKRGFPSLLTSFFKLSGLAVRFPRSKVFARYHLGHLDKNTNNQVDVLAGAFILIRHEILLRTGAFDERFFMYGEDIDLSYRVQQAGWQNWYFASNSIIHFKGESTKKGSLNYVRMFYEAMYLFVQKHYGGKNAGLYRQFIRAAIWSRAGITVAATFLRQFYFRFLPTAKNRKGDEKFLVIALPEDLKRVSNLLNENGRKSSCITHYLPTQNLHPILMTAKATDQILFCIGESLSLKTVMAAMENVPGKQYAFYFSCGRSIILSYSKNNSGNWIATH